MHTILQNYNNVLTRQLHICIEQLFHSLMSKRQNKFTLPRISKKVYLQQKHQYVKCWRIVLSNCALLDVGSVRQETCKILLFKTLWWFWRIVCICWFTFQQINCNAPNGKCKIRLTIFTSSYLRWTKFALIKYWC